MRVLAIDFGTSNTVAALLIEGQAPRTVTFDASPLLPSAVYLDPDGQLTVGRDAQRLARLDPTRFEPNPKRRIDDGEVLLGDRAVPVVQLIGAVLRTVAVEVRRQLGGAPPDEVRLTHPAQWGASRQNVLVSAARAAGLGANLLLIAEPVAAAAQFTRLPGRALPPGGTVAVYDLGGGTFDIAVVGRTLAAPGVHATGQHSTGLRSTGQHSTAQNGAAGRDGEFHVLAEAGSISTRRSSSTSAGSPRPPTSLTGSGSCARPTRPGAARPGLWPRMSGPPRKRCRAIRRPRSPCPTHLSTRT